MQIAFVGCCYVFDIDATRFGAVALHCTHHAYASYEALLVDPMVNIIANITRRRSHSMALRQALEATVSKAVVVMLRKVLANAASAATRRLALRQAPNVCSALMLARIVSTSHLDAVLSYAPEIEVPA